MKIEFKTQKIGDEFKYLLKNIPSQPKSDIKIGPRGLFLWMNGRYPSRIQGLPHKSSEKSISLSAIFTFPK